MNLNELIRLVKTVFPDGELFLEAHDYPMGNSIPVFELKVGFDHIRHTYPCGMSTESFALLLCEYMCKFKLDRKSKS